MNAQFLKMELLLEAPCNDFIDFNQFKIIVNR